MKIIAIDIRLIGRKRTGDEMVFLNLVRELLLLSSENEYWLLTDRKDPRFLSELKNLLGIRDHHAVRIISLWGRNRFFWNLISVPVFLFYRRVDIFHTQYILPAFVPSRTWVVSHIHDVSFRIFPELISFSDRKLLAFFIPHTMKRADVLVAPSLFTENEIISQYGVDESKILVLPNAVSADFKESLLQPLDLEAVRKKYHLPDKFLLSVGTLQPRKNLPLFLRAFAEIENRIPEMSVVIAGNRKGHHFDTEIDRVIAEKQLAKKVFFPGFIEQSDLPALYRLAHGLVFPSRYEGFGIPILEAFLAGIPVAASDIPALKEVGGEACLYFSEGVAECGNVLYTLCTHEAQRKSCIEAGIRRAQEYSWAKSAHILSSCYEQLLSR